MKAISPLARNLHWCDRSGLLVIILFSIALTIRLLALGRYVTPDELIWVYRSVLFREALRAGTWADTLVAGHPGVITTWLGTLGISAQLMMNSADLEAYQWITHIAWLTPDNMLAFQKLSGFLSVGRFLVAAVTSLGIVAIFFLARRLLSSCLAFLLAFLLAIDPFIAGLSGLLHVDGLVTTFVMLSLLSLALATGFGGVGEPWKTRLVYASVSGGTAALAVLSKSPALLLVPLTGLVLFLLIWQDRNDPFHDRLRRSIILGLVWIGSFLLLAILLFPALWTTPGQVLQLAGGNANRHFTEALRPTFFLGQVAYDHGLLFYPVALAWRIGPVITLGLLALAVFVFRRDGRNNLPLKTAFIFMLWTLFFIGLIAMTAKKFDRYALPVIPALTVLAVIGWGYWLRLGDRWGRFVLFLLMGLQVLYLLFVLPYPLSAYNPLLGGPFTARQVLPIGWGEGISSAGKWLSNIADVEQKSAVSGIAPSLAPFFAGQTLQAEDRKQLEADYIILTANSWQNDPQYVEQLTDGLDLLHIIRFGGLDQSWIYSNPFPKSEDLTFTDLSIPISFDGKIKMLSQDLQVTDGEVRFTARWARQSPVGRYLVKLRVVDENGNLWNEFETALLNEVYFYPENWSPGETPAVTYEMDFAPTTPPGQYNLELSLVDEVTGAQLPITADDSFIGVIFDVGEVNWDVPGADSPIDMSDIVQLDDETWFSDSLRLLGYSMNPQSIVAGADLNLDIFWQAQEILPGDIQVALQIGDEEPVILPLSRFDSAEWQPGRIIQEKYRLPVPPEIAADTITVGIWPLPLAGHPADAKVELGDINVLKQDRLYFLPEEISLPMAVRFEPGIFFRGASPSSISIARDGNLPLTLYWQAEVKTDEPVTAFVHLVNENGDIIAQTDRWPGGLPSDTWAAGQVIIDNYELQIPPNIQPGKYQIVIGLYNAGNGIRLAAEDPDGQEFPNDRVILPMLVEILP